MDLLDFSIGAIFLINHEKGIFEHKAQKGFKDKITDKREVFQMVAEGSSTKKIAETLCVSPSTVKSHRSNIMEKLKIIIEKLKMDNLSQLIQYAIQLGIIDIQI